MSFSFLREASNSSMAGVEKILNRRINQFGVAQPNIQKDPNKNRLYVELPGVQDEATVAEKLQSTANLQFFETMYLSDPEIADKWADADKLSKENFSPENKKKKSLSALIKPGGLSIGAVKPDDKKLVDEILSRTEIISVINIICKRQ